MQFKVEMEYDDGYNPGGEWTVRVSDYENGDSTQSVFSQWDAAVEFARWWLDK